jgi:hypothetical protein
MYSPRLSINERTYNFLYLMGLVRLSEEATTVFSNSINQLFFVTDTQYEVFN